MNKVQNRSIATRIEETGGHASGFDYMRLFLSLSIVSLHSGIICYGLKADQAIFMSAARPLVRFVLPAFFALSGFLVSGSLERSKTLGMFLGLRVLRIYPALAVEVLLSAIILGPMITTVALQDYFSDPKFFLYLRNVVGDVHFYLPGVFAGNPEPDIVNGQLWTIPFELGCYIVLAGLAILGLKRQRWVAPCGVIVITIAYLLTTLLRHHWTIVFVPGAINGALLIATFLSGVTIYFYRDVLPWSFATFAIAAITAAVFLGFLPYGDFFAPVPVAYATVYLGLLNPNRRMLRGADYSYGIFLYGFTVQQAIWFAFPFAREWLINMLISVPAVVLVAALSWYCVERPAQGLRFVLKRLEAWYLGRKERRTMFLATANQLQREES